MFTFEHLPLLLLSSKPINAMPKPKYQHRYQIIIQ